MISGSFQYTGHAKNSFKSYGVDAAGAAAEVAVAEPDVSRQRPGPAC